MITSRDQRVIDFLKSQPADFATIYKLFFSGTEEDLPKTSEPFARERLRKLAKRGHIRISQSIEDTRANVYSV